MLTPVYSVMRCSHPLQWKFGASSNINYSSTLHVSMTMSLICVMKLKRIFLMMFLTILTLSKFSRRILTDFTQKLHIFLSSKYFWTFCFFNYSFVGLGWAEAFSFVVAQFSADALASSSLSDETGSAHLESLLGLGSLLGKCLLLLLFWTLWLWLLRFLSSLTDDNAAWASVEVVCNKLFI